MSSHPSGITRRVLLFLTTLFCCSVKFIERTGILNISNSEEGCSRSHIFSNNKIFDLHTYAINDSFPLMIFAIDNNLTFLCALTGLLRVRLYAVGFLDSHYRDCLCDNRGHIFPSEC